MITILKNSKISISFIGLSVFAMGVISLLSHLQILPYSENLKPFVYVLRIIACTSAFVFFCMELERPLFSRKNFTFDNLLFLGIAGFLVLCINQRVGIYAGDVFLLFALIYCIAKRKIYVLNPIHYVLIAYAIFQVFGTIGTIRGFHFPEKYWFLILVPFASCFFHLTREMAYKIMRVLVWSMMIYMTISLIFWWYNLQFADIGVWQWMTGKESVMGKAAYEWVAEWSGYGHPSYVCLVLFPVFISLIYLVYKRLMGFTWVDLIIFSVLLLLSIAAMESRIGLVCFIFIVGVSGLFLSYFKRRHFKKMVLLTFCGIATVSLLFSEKISGFVEDPARKTLNTLAISYIKEHIWWGTGSREIHIGLMDQAEKMSAELPITDLGIVNTYAHNQFLGNMVQYGVWGALILTVLLICWFGYAIRNRSYVLLMYLCVVFFYMMIEEPLTGQAGITRITVFFMFFVAFINSGRKIKYYDFSQKGIFKHLP